ncbi:heavy metal sensor histidine kinase [Pseudomonas nitroreducens]|uniref:Sensor protein n=1 Tax=Pseudomonas nitroreducens TaxID=46680 RepID=A0ABS0KDZ0_PSENT|nr:MULTISPECIES: heavy metal sensor histidine kinase [Pseudomonas]MBG6286294.1 heavy metal sensor histidine kinase [Pseudomonas nitroreducens]MDG9857948.1 heavy metal sensor histidine kinase [Pseudomonas nitroreducens]MDH1077017.1 heavy metal sensor histidine kinase [Pseudomonas nitroreducens]NNN25463.1 heavy metal sensor histidine kinase [Pseudomonas nitroreducens]UCL90205.1 heavy metal sensor histidine kinase [Pseudomonas sp. HS-18]
MKRLSLTARMSLMFMLAVVSVLTVAGVSFSEFSRRHFWMQDQQTITEKLDSIQQILMSANANLESSHIRLELNALLGAHHELESIITTTDGNVLFSNSTITNLPAQFSQESASMWEWGNHGRLYRGMTARVGPQSGPSSATAVLILDVTSHSHFFVTLERWFWIGLAISAIASGALGVVVVRSGLRPIRQVTAVAASMSAKSLKERIPLDPVPSELQELVSSFNEMLARLDDSFMRLSNFSADIAHELRTPITTLLTHTEVILGKKRSIDDYEENLYSNLDSLHHMSRMIDDMLFLAKSDNGLITPGSAKINLEEIVRRLFEYYSLLAEERGIELRLNGSSCIQGDSLMLHRAISNLLSNAVRYTPAGATIEVFIESNANTVTLSVVNPGETIPSEHLKKLFDRFYRADPARREGESHNAGLGLAISRSIVEAHHGRIWCTSSDGMTAFHLEFPHRP